MDLGELGPRVGSVVMEEWAELGSRYATFVDPLLELVIADHPGGRNDVQYLGGPAGGALIYWERPNPFVWLESAYFLRLNTLPSDEMRLQVREHLARAFGQILVATTRGTFVEKSLMSHLRQTLGVSKRALDSCVDWGHQFHVDDREPLAPRAPLWRGARAVAGFQNPRYAWIRELDEQVMDPLRESLGVAHRGYPTYEEIFTEAFVRVHTRRGANELVVSLGNALAIHFAIGPWPNVPLYPLEVARKWQAQRPNYLAAWQRTDRLREVYWQTEYEFQVPSRLDLSGLDNREVEFAAVQLEQYRRSITSIRGEAVTVTDNRLSRAPDDQTTYNFGLFDHLLEIGNLGPRVQAAIRRHYGHIVLHEPTALDPIRRIRVGDLSAPEHRDNGWNFNSHGRAPGGEPAPVITLDESSWGKFESFDDERLEREVRVKFRQIMTMSHIHAIGTARARAVAENVISVGFGVPRRVVQEAFPPLPGDVTRQPRAGTDDPDVVHFRSDKAIELRRRVEEAIPPLDPSDQSLEQVVAASCAIAHEDPNPSPLATQIARSVKFFVDREPGDPPMGVSKSAATEYRNLSPAIVLAGYRMTSGPGVVSTSDIKVEDIQRAAAEIERFREEVTQVESPVAQEQQPPARRLRLVAGGRSDGVRAQLPADQPEGRGERDDQNRAGRPAGPAEEEHDERRADGETKDSRSSHPTTPTSLNSRTHAHQRPRPRGASSRHRDVAGRQNDGLKRQPPGRPGRNRFAPDPAQQPASQSESDIIGRQERVPVADQPVADPPAADQPGASEPPTRENSTGARANVPQQER